jgi:hypothetical protein
MLPSTYVAAFCNRIRSPETNCWLFSSFELTTAAELSTADSAECAEQMVALMRAIKNLRKDVPSNSAHSSAASTEAERDILVVGSVHSLVVAALMSTGLIDDLTILYHKFLFRRISSPSSLSSSTDASASRALPDELTFATVRREHLPFVLSRTHIPRQEHTLALLPSVAVVPRSQPDGPPVAWAFLGLDGSLSSLHCEEAYRGKGLAKAVTSRLFREEVSVFAGQHGDGLVENDDRWAHADVALDNVGSQGVARSLGGTVGWDVHWVFVDLH